ERFRGDLYYRIRGLELHMPALEEIPDDVPEFVAHFLDIEGRRLGQAKSMAPAVMERLVARSWPGNVRELRNEVRRLYALSGEHIDDPGLVRSPSRPPEGSLSGSLAEIERRAIEQAIQRFGGDKRAAAGALGISRAKIYQRIKEWAAEPE
ncbi:MAG: sigma-54-dependent Fis family transcriptional regulator, partial [Myxococcales bacterium]|nr:sigma-54-dependent Fis family transcriptional regulator [Myxococcales bacterium]